MESPVMIRCQKYMRKCVSDMGGDYVMYPQLFVPPIPEHGHLRGLLVTDFNDIDLGYVVESDAPWNTFSLRSNDNSFATHASVLVPVDVPLAVVLAFWHACEEEKRFNAALRDAQTLFRETIGDDTRAKSTVRVRTTAEIDVDRAEWNQRQAEYRASKGLDVDDSDSDSD